MSCSQAHIRHIAHRSLAQDSVIGDFANEVLRPAPTRLSRVQRMHDLLVLVSDLRVSLYQDTPYAAIQVSRGVAFEV